MHLSEVDRFVRLVSVSTIHHHPLLTGLALSSQPDTSSLLDKHFHISSTREQENGGKLRDRRFFFQR